MSGSVGHRVPIILSIVSSPHSLRLRWTLHTQVSPVSDWTALLAFRGTYSSAFTELSRNSPSITTSATSFLSPTGQKRKYEVMSVGTPPCGGRSLMMMVDLTDESYGASITQICDLHLEFVEEGDAFHEHAIIILHPGRSCDTWILPLGPR
jgi:hypothetical protein